MNAPKTKVAAKCGANQAALDRLSAKRARLAPSNNYGYTLRKAMESLRKCKEPILTNKDALALPGVGPAIAKLIVPSEPSTSNRDNSTGSTSNTSVARKPRAKRKQPPPLAADTAEPPQAKSKKELAYEKAHSTALDWKTLPCCLTWRVLLLIDGRERQSDHMQAKCQMSGIPTEERQLPIGDMAWIAQGYAGTDTNNPKKLKAELLLGTIVERKTIEDLKASLFGTRYAEQRLRLKETGCPQVLFLIEGDMNKDLFRCPSDTLHSAVWETRLHCDFSIVHTAHMDDTVKNLKRMHRRILQRTFPAAFSNEALPTFAEADARGVRRQDASAALDPSRRRRRRVQSLIEMTFDIDPVPPFGLKRFLTYAEIKAKVEWDREQGTRTVGNIHRAMLKQVTTCSAKKCNAIANVYPTPSHLLQAYGETSNLAEKKSLVADIVTSDASKSARDLKVGPRSSAEVFVAYGLEEGEADLSSSDETSSNQHSSQQKKKSGTQSRIVSSSQSSYASSAAAAVPQKTAAHIATQAPEYRRVAARSASNATSEASVAQLTSSSTQERKPAAARKWSPVSSGERGRKSSIGWQDDDSLDLGISNSFCNNRASSPESTLPFGDVVASTEAEEVRQIAKSSILDISFASSVDISPPVFMAKRRTGKAVLESSSQKDYLGLPVGFSQDSNTSFEASVSNPPMRRKKRGPSIEVIEID